MIHAMTGTFHRSVLFHASLNIDDMLNEFRYLADIDLIGF